MELKDEGFKCSCDTCKSMCSRPCWPTPEEAERLIDAGFASKLMLDYWVGDAEDGGDIDLLCPANPGSEGRRADTFDIRRGCIFHVEGLCQLHDSGLKPIEGKMARCKDSPSGIHFAIAKTWDTPKGKQVIARWNTLKYIEVQL